MKIHLSIICTLVVTSFAAVHDSDVDGGSSLAPKTHTLFMGADLDLQQNKGFYRVENVIGGSFVIKPDGKEVKIPMKFSSVNMKVGRALKLTENSANVGKLVVDRAYTPANDPNNKFVKSLAASAADAQLSIATYRMYGSGLKTAGRDNPETNAYGTTAAEMERQKTEAANAFNAAAGALGSDMNSAGYGAGKLQAELEEGMYDAVEITFEVSAPKPLNSPYAVILAHFREKDEKRPDAVQSWVYATELDPITPQVRRVRIKQGGFPRGFELTDYQLHLYNRGQEVATPVAEKRVELTRDEAFEYVMIDYLHANKGKTLPATLAMGRLSPEVRNNLQTPTVFVKVTKDGLATTAFSDESCSRPVDDPVVVAAIRDLRFKPALEKGKAVEGVARLGSS